MITPAPSGGTSGRVNGRCAAACCLPVTCDDLKDYKVCRVNDRIELETHDEIAVRWHTSLATQTTCRYH